MKQYSALGLCSNNINSGSSTFDILVDISYHFGYTVSRFKELNTDTKYLNTQKSLNDPRNI